PLVGAGLIVSAALGVLASPSALVVNLGVVVVALASAALAYAFRLGPPGPIFFVLVFGLSAHVVATSPVPPLVYLLALAGGCVFSYLLSLTPLLRRRVRAVRARPLRDVLPGPALDVDARILLLRVAIVS